MRVDEWFDPHSLEHIEALAHLNRFGSWPAGFIPETVDFGPAWLSLIHAKIADEWIKYMLPSEDA
jgi:hypothetical protein